MDLALGEVFGGAGVALAAGHHKVRGIYSGARIRRGQNFVNAMAAGAIRRERRAVLRRKSMIALEESLHPVRRQIVFSIQSLRSMAIAAYVS